MYTKASALTSVLAMRIIATILLAIAIMVLVAWHDVQRTTEIYLLLRTMAYSTALCFLLSGIALTALSWQRLFIIRVAAMIVATIAVITLVEIYGFSDLGVNRQMMFFVAGIPPTPVPMAATTAVSFFLTGVILFLLSAQAPRARSMMVIFFMSVVAIITAIIALLAHAIGHLPAFEWLGVKMAPPTAVAFILLIVALLVHGYPYITAAFKQLSFFGHILIAFGFMALVFIGTGSVVLAQIDNMAAAINRTFVARSGSGHVSRQARRTQQLPFFFTSLASTNARTYSLGKRVACAGSH